MTYFVFFSLVKHCDLHLLKESILSLEAEPCGTTQVMEGGGSVAKTLEWTKCFILQLIPIRKLLFVKIFVNSLQRFPPPLFSMSSHLPLPFKFIFYILDTVQHCRLVLNSSVRE